MNRFSSDDSNDGAVSASAGIVGIAAALSASPLSFLQNNPYRRLNLSGVKSKIPSSAKTKKRKKQRAAKIARRKNRSA